MDVFEMILLLALGVYIASGWAPPRSVLRAAGSWWGYACITILLFGLLQTENVPLVAAGCCAAFLLLRQSEQTTHLGFMHEFFPSEATKWSQFPAPHEYEYTLEEEMVRERAPHLYNPTYQSTPWKPVLGDSSIESALLFESNKPIL